ncbi:MAG: aspartyl protease family protein [Bacteroidota bacterium]
MRRLTIFLFALPLFLQLQAQAPLATMPYEIYGDFMIIPIEINHSESLDFIFDTADGLTVLNNITADHLGLKSGKKQKGTGAGGLITGQLIKHQEVDIGTFAIEDVELYVTSLNHLEMALGRHIDGIIGYDLLKNYVVEISYDDKEFHIYDSKDFQYEGDGQEFDVKLTWSIPHIPAKVELVNGEVLEGEYWVDTGARTSLDFNTPLVHKHGLLDKVGEYYTYYTAGIGAKEAEHHKGRVKKLSFGDFSFDNVPTGLSEAARGIQSNKKVDGIIGDEILERFNITFDYPKKKMYFEPNALYDKEFLVDASGIGLQLDPTQSKVLIHEVHEHSPAMEAGLQVNDEITGVNGKPASNFSLVELREMLCEDGKILELEVSSGGAKKTIAIELKEVI